MSLSYKRHRFLVEIISHCVWLYYTFPLSFRDIQKLMLYRGIKVIYEVIRKWRRKFAQAYANHIHRHRPKPADKRHREDLAIKINGKKYCLWRTVDKDSQVIDILMQCRRMKRLPTISSISYSSVIPKGDHH